MYYDIIGFITSKTTRFTALLAGIKLLVATNLVGLLKLPVLEKCNFALKWPWQGELIVTNELTTVLKAETQLLAKKQSD